METKLTPIYNPNVGDFLHIYRIENGETDECLTRCIHKCNKNDDITFKFNFPYDLKEKKLYRHKFGWVNNDGAIKFIMVLATKDEISLYIEKLNNKHLSIF